MTTEGTAAMAEEQEAQVAENALAAELGDDHPLVKALRAERETVKTLKREKRFLEVSGKFPDLGLKPDWFKGRTPDEYESFAQELATLASSKAKAPEAGSTASAAPAAAEPETEATDHPIADAAAKMARSEVGGGAVQKISFAEAAKLPWAERRELILKGAVEGVRPPSA
jgi:hypothetical protein